MDETASWDVLCCLGSLPEPVLYLRLPLMRALTFDTVAWWYRTVPRSASPPCVSVLGPPAAPSPVSLTCSMALPLPWLPEKLPGYLQGQGWGFLFVFGFFLFLFLFFTSGKLVWGILACSMCAGSVCARSAWKVFVLGWRPAVAAPAGTGLRHWVWKGAGEVPALS